MNVIFGNYGNNTVALIQWALEQGIEDVCVLHVETGWAADGWAERVTQGQHFAADCGFTPIALKPPSSFAEQIIDRGRFPSVKFQWCAGFLKGLAFLAWADQHDALCEARVLLPSRRSDSRARFNLAEFEPDHPHYGGREVWYPLYQTNDLERDRLIARTPFEKLSHRSLECHPCVHSPASEWQSLSGGDQAKVAQIEQVIGHAIATTSDLPTSTTLEAFDMGCGAQYACGE